VIFRSAQATTRAPATAAIPATELSSAMDRTAETEARSKTADPAMAERSLTVE